jgi:hypothetical protein
MSRLIPFLLGPRCRSAAGERDCLSLGDHGLVIPQHTVPRERRPFFPPDFPATSLSQFHADALLTLQERQTERTTTDYRLLVEETIRHPEPILTSLPMLNLRKGPHYVQKPPTKAKDPASPLAQNQSGPDAHFANCRQPCTYVHPLLQRANVSVHWFAINDVSTLRACLQSALLRVLADTRFNGPGRGR